MGGGGCQVSSAVVLDVMVKDSIVGLAEGAGGREAEEEEQGKRRGRGRERGEREAGGKRRGMGEGGWWNGRDEDEKGNDRGGEGRRKNEVLHLLFAM